MILPFSGLEMLALGVALYVTSRKAHFREVIISSDKRISVEKGIRRIKQKWVFDRCWVKMVRTKYYGRSIVAVEKSLLGSHGSYVESRRIS